MDRIAKIGFYSPAKPCDPVARLAAVLEESRNELPGSLLVLPEAFNIGVPYVYQAKIDTDPEILCELQKLCSGFDICFVAGLIIRGPVCNYNSSYVIDASGAALLCHKKLSDSTDLYTTCDDGCDGHNAIAYRNVALCSLICMDAYNATCWPTPTDEAIRQRHAGLKAKMDQLSSCEHRVMCVPAYIKSDCIGKTKADFWGIPNSYRIVANSANKSKSPGSFIQRIDQPGAPVVRLAELRLDDNQAGIRLYNLPDSKQPQLV